MKQEIIDAEYVEHMSDELKSYHLYVENQVIEYIIHGRSRQLLNLMLEVAERQLPHGEMAASDLRSMKNFFITSSAIARHRCILAGLDTSLANAIADQYAQRVETVDSVDNIELLITQMLLAYSHQMAKLQEYAGTNPIVHKIISYVNSHIYNKITLHMLSQEFGYSSEHLCRVFQGEMHQTVTSYINYIKMDEAKHLLRYTNYSILDISVMLQFSSQSYFQKTFKKVVGITPQQFRTQRVSLPDSYTSS